MTATSFAAVALGLAYVFHAFGPTEAEVVTWGLVCVWLGGVLVVASLLLARSQHILANVALALGFSTLALLQLLPAGLWFIFHGRGISDGTPPSQFVAHWAYALPHLLLAVTSALVVHRTVQGLVRSISPPSQP